MVKAKTGITLLKRLGFVLIALPEPFTTPIGVACILASGYLSQLREARLNKHLRETLTRYLSHTKRSNAETDNESHARQKLKGYTRTEDPTILWQNKSIRDVEATRPTSIRRTRRDKRDNTVHHRVDTEFLSRRYAVTDKSEAKAGSSHSDVASDETEKLIHHNVDTKFLTRRYAVTDSLEARTGSHHSDVAPEETEELIHHNVDTQFLARRYAVTDSSEARTGSNHSDVAPEETEEMIYHNVDTQFLARRYAVTDGVKAPPESSHSDVALVYAEKMILHSIDMQMLGRRYWTEDGTKSASNLDGKPGPAENLVNRRIQTVSTSRHYQSNDCARTDANEARTPDTAKMLERRSRKITVSDETPTFDAMATFEHHSIDLQFLSRRYETVCASPVKTKARPLAMSYA